MKRCTALVKHNVLRCGGLGYRRKRRIANIQFLAGRLD